MIEQYGLYCANKVKNNNFQYFRGNYSGVTGRILAHYRVHPRSCGHKHFKQVWSRLIKKCGLYRANKKRVNGRTHDGRTAMT